MPDCPVTDLVCLHLQSVEDAATNPVPFAASVPGITEALERDGETVADKIALMSALSELSESGLVSERTAPVADSDEERTVYSLTADGEEHARTCRERLRTEDLTVRTHGGEATVALEDVSDYLDSPVDDPLVTALARADGDLLVAEDIDDRSDGSADPPPGAETFVGREDERAALLDSFERVCSGAPERLLVVGEPGVGKTTLVRTLASTVADRDGQFCYGRCRRTVEEPYAPFVAAARELPGEVGAGLVERLTQPAAVAAGGREALAAQRGVRFEAIGDELAAVGEESPLVVFIDDLQWIDHSSALLLAALARRGIENVFLVGAARPETISGESTLADALEGLDADACDRLDLAPLNRQATRQLVRTTLGALNVPSDFEDAIYARTDGNPLFVHETVVELVDTGVVDPELGVYPDSLDEHAVSETVDSTVGSRLDHLDEAARSLLEIGSVAGDAIPLALLERVSDLDATRVRDYVSLLVDCGLWRLDDAGDRPALYFESGVWGVAIYDRLSKAPRRRLHARIAAAYREWTTANDTEDTHTHTVADSAADRDTDADAETDVATDGELAATIAYHERMAGNDAAALAAYRRAGEHAESVYAHEVAIEAYEWAADLARDLDREDVLLDVLEQLGDVHSVLAASDDAVRAYEFVRERTDDTARRQRLCRKQAAAHFDAGDHESLLAVVDAGLALGDEPDASPVETARLHAKRGRGLRQCGDTNEAIDAVEHALDLLDGVDPEANPDADLIDIEYAIRADLATCYERQGDYEQADHIFSDIIGTRRKRDDRRKLASALASYGYDRKRMGHPDEGLEAIEKAIDIFQEVGDQMGLISALNNAAISYQDRDDLARARDLYSDALDIARAADNDRARATLHVNIGNLTNFLGDLDACRRHLDRAAALNEGLEIPISDVFIGAGLATERYVRGDLEAALDHAHDALETAREIDDQARIIRATWTVGYVQLARGEIEAAIDAFETAVDTAVAQTLNTTSEARSGLVYALVGADRIDAAAEQVEAIEAAADDLPPHTTGEMPAQALGLYYRAVGEFDTARERIAGALDRLDAANKPITESKVRLEASRVEAAVGNDDRARDHATWARETAADSDAQGIVAAAEDALAAIDGADDADGFPGVRLGALERPVDH